MKPFIIIIHSDGKIQLTEEEFGAYIDKAYTQGYHDGFEAAKSSSITTTPINPINPIDPPNTTNPWHIGDLPTNPWHIGDLPVVYCNGTECSLKQTSTSHPADEKQN